MITKCYHLFCRECVKANIDARIRKCPECSLPFGHNEHRRIYLT